MPPTHRCTSRCVGRFPCSNCEERTPVTIDVRHNGVKIGEVRPAAGGYLAYLQTGGTGFDTPLPELFPAPGAAIDAIRDAHEPEPDHAELGGESG